MKNLQTVLGSTSAPPRRSAPFDVEPGFYEPSDLWMYGNTRLLKGRLEWVLPCFGAGPHTPSELEAIEREAERIVLAGATLVCGIHNPAHQRAAIVPLRWGAPRILVLSGAFQHHLGENLKEEPFRAARLWRYQWDPHTDLAISRRAPEKKPTFATHNPTIDRLIARIASRKVHGLLFQLGRRPEDLDEL